MDSKISSEKIKKYAIVLFFVGIAFMLFYNNLTGYKIKQVNELSSVDIGEKVEVCGIIESKNKGKNTIFLRLKEENSTKFIDTVIFQKDQIIINLELSDYDYSLSELSKGNHICIEGRYEKYNNDFEIIVKRISEIKE
ncbi:MAG: hypothetical protein KAQ92_04045 [Candidatus Aenigmarchaeota archaeon]|nr:hypothetical protein [Candidatus Aenigmarchaeota archaeon]